MLSFIRRVCQLNQWLQGPSEFRDPQIVLLPSGLDRLVEGPGGSPKPTLVLFGQSGFAKPTGIMDPQ